MKPMETDARRAKLKEIMKSRPCARKEIHYNNERKSMDVFRIPLECLVFNQLNGRIATFVKTHEKQHGHIDATTEEGEKQIFRFLWDSQVSRNKATQKDLREKGQLEYGIVTADGVVIDGNRRFMLLKKNKAEGSDATAYFKAIILEDTLESNPKEIMRLETTYQMGVDDKVDYNPIQKYLKCRDLKGEGFSENEIAKMMGEKSAKIKEYLSILGLMDDYLEECGYAGMYRILEIQKLEGHLVDLNNYLSKYRGQGRIHDMNWVPEKYNIDELRTVYFDHMRAGFGVHDIRIIANPSKGQGIFTQKDLWGGFSEKHFDSVKQNDDEKSLEAMKEKHPGMDVVDLISARDRVFRKQLENKLKGNLGRTSRELEDQKDEDKPIELLQRAKKTLEKVKTNVSTFGTQEVRDLAKAINKQAYELMKAAEEKMKS